MAVWKLLKHRLGGVLRAENRCSGVANRSRWPFGRVLGSSWGLLAGLGAPLQPFASFLMVQVRFRDPQGEGRKHERRIAAP